LKQKVISSNEYPKVTGFVTTIKNCSCVCVHINTALNSSDNFPSYHPDNHHSSDDVYWRGGERLQGQMHQEISIIMS